MPTETTPRLPRGWKIYSVEASDGRCKMSIDFEFTGGTSPKEAIKRMAQMIKDFK